MQTISKIWNSKKFHLLIFIVRTIFLFASLYCTYMFSFKGKNEKITKIKRKRR